MVRASINWFYLVMASRAFPQSTLVSQYKMRPDHPEAFSHPVYTFPCTGGLLNKQFSRGDCGAGPRCMNRVWEGDTADSAQWRLRTTLCMDTLQVSLRIKFEKASLSTKGPCPKQQRAFNSVQYEVSSKAGRRPHEDMDCSELTPYLQGCF